MRFRKLIAAVSGSLLLSSRAFAQGCAACYTTTAAGGTQTVHALRSGIVLLAIPPALIFAGIMVALIRWETHSQKRQF